MIRRLLRIVVLLAVVAGFVARVPDLARAEGVYSGACILILEVTPSATITALPAQLTLQASGGGMCETNRGSAWMDLSIAVTTHPSLGGFSCAGGFAAGSGTVELDLPGFPSLPLEVTVLTVGPSAEMVATAEVTRFDGVASFAHDVLDAASCPAATGTWTGVLAFQDPDPIVVP